MINTATGVDYADVHTISGNLLNEVEGDLNFAGAPIVGPTSVLGDYRIQAGSSAINFGDSTIPSIPSDDYDGNNRDFAGNAVDAGAFEL